MVHEIYWAFDANPSLEVLEVYLSKTFDKTLHEDFYANQPFCCQKLNQFNIVRQ